MFYAGRRSSGARLIGHGKPRQINDPAGLSAETAGFEPASHVSTATPLAGERFRPLSHVSKLPQNSGFDLPNANQYSSRSEPAEHGHLLSGCASGIPDRL